MEEGFQNELMRDVLGRSMPEEVLGNLYDQGFEAEQLFPIAFPDHVGAEILRGMADSQRLTPPMVKFAMDWTMSYRDSRAEQAYLKWENYCLLGTRTQNWLSGVVLFATALFAYFYVFQCQNSKNQFAHWPCEGWSLWASLTVLIWTLPMWSAVQTPIVWQYRDIVCALHQVCFGCFVVTVSKQLANTGEDNLSVVPDPIWFCAFPVFIESVIARVRLKYYLATSTLLIGLVVSPWFVGMFDNSVLSWGGWLMNWIIMVVGPGCLLVLYEFMFRKCYESGFK